MGKQKIKWFILGAGVIFLFGGVEIYKNINSETTIESIGKLGKEKIECEVDEKSNRTKILKVVDDRKEVYYEAKKGFEIGGIKIFEDGIFFEEYKKDKEINVPYHLKYKTDSEVIKLKSTIVDGLNYGNIMDVISNDNFIAYRFDGITKNIVEVFNKKDKKVSVKYENKRVGENILSNIDIDEEKIVFAESFNNKSDLYYFDLDEDFKKVKEIDGCQVAETYLTDKYIYLNCSQGNSGLEHIKRLDRTTLKEERLLNIEDIEKVEGNDYGSNPMRIRVLDDNTILIASNTDDYFKYEIKSKEIKILKDGKEWDEFENE